MTELDRKLIGQKLKEVREYLGFSQEEVATYLGIPRPAISLIESGKRKVESTEMAKLSKLYNRPVEDLAGIDVVQASKEDLPKVEIIQRAIGDLSQEDRDEVLKFAEYLKAKSKMRE
jgi:transcriptional regulator with XRE-family HTH domain